MNKTDTLIIGAGPAGIAAAIQLKRFGLSPILLEKDRVGGLLRNANLVENYPGFPNGIPGPKLVALFEKQIQRIGVPVTYGEVVRLDFKDDRFVADVGRVSIPATRGQVRNPPYESHFVVIASGTKPKPFPLEISPQMRNKVFSEVWPLLKARGKHVTIVGAGDAAFDYALNLAGRENTVTILNRSHATVCLPLLRERASANPSITYQEQTAIQRVETDVPTGRLQLFTDNCSLITDYLIFAIGREPQMDFLSEGVKLQAQRLVEDGKLYLVGDVHNGPFRQTAIAVGEGLRAAMQIYELMSLRGCSLPEAISSQAGIASLRSQ